MSHLVTTPVTPEICPRCGRLALVGLAEGLRARTDPTPITAGLEVALLLAGEWTYTLTRSGLVHRDAGRIRSGQPAGPVLAGHRCDRPIPAQPSAAAPPAAATSEEIPF